MTWSGCCMIHFTFVCFPGHNPHSAARPVDYVEGHRHHLQPRDSIGARPWRDIYRQLCDQGHEQPVILCFSHLNSPAGGRMSEVRMPDIRGQAILTSSDIWHPTSVSRITDI